MHRIFRGLASTIERLMQPRRDAKCARLESEAVEVAAASTSRGVLLCLPDTAASMSREVLNEFFAQPAYLFSFQNNISHLELLFCCRTPRYSAVASYAAGLELARLNRLKLISRSHVCSLVVKRLILFRNKCAVRTPLHLAKHMLLRRLPSIVLDVLHVSRHESDAAVTSSTGTCGIPSRDSLLLPRQLSGMFGSSSHLIPSSIVNGDTLVLLSRRGEGDFGIVHEVFHREQNSFYALKKMKRRVKNKRHLSACLREVDIMRQLRISPHVVRYFDSWTSDYLHIQMELCFGNFCQVTGKRFHSEEFMMRVLAHVSCALCTMHGLGLVHLDIKPENIYVASGHSSMSPIFKIGDFGTARSVKDTDDIDEGTNTYLAPELLHGNYSMLDKADIFSLGVMVYECVRGQRMTAQCAAILRTTGFVPRFTDRISDDLFALLEQMMQTDASLRPSARDITALPRVRSMFIDSPELLPSLQVQP